MISNEAFPSPRIVALQQDLKKGDNAALDAFWREIRRQGTPLVENIPDVGEFVFVTFIWQGTRTTSNVVVRCDDFRWTNIVGSPGVRENAMANLPGTDVWYKTYRIRSDYCIDYLLSPNDPELLGAETDPWVDRWLEVTSTWQLDPLNPRQIRIAYDEEDHPEREEGLAGSTWMKSLNSYIELPGYDPNPWYKERQISPKGQVEKHRFSSSILSNTRSIFTYTPPGYTAAEDEPYGLLVLFDAWIYHQVIPTPVILDNLSAEGLIPQLVAVIIDQPDLRDRDEMIRNPPFLNFLTQELLPWVRQNYHITSDPTQTIVGGSSLSGLAAGLTALQHADIFGKVIMQSGAFKWNPDFGRDIPAGEEEEWLASEFTSRPILPLQFYLDVGQFEDLLSLNRNMRDALLAKGYPVHYQEFYGGHNVLCWRKTLADGLLALMRSGKD
ncbi:MAG TPA: alpha/beta hydrolase-fold protein [candidate division Zixibacteria bacterium]|nr:alpha/beta hydrolase-fold protein [candidate division Zixibacteria bacterium]